MDVLEHIEDDRGEVARAARHLRPGGHIIALSPAHQWLFTPFDRAIGHYRRYTRSSFGALAPKGSRQARLVYLDSIGLFASLANKLVLKSAMPKPSQVAFWDRVLVRMSRLVDPVLGYSAGKSVLAVWRKVVLMPNRVRLGYLTSVYGRASDTFIRSEVAVLRSLGHEVRTFSIRRPAPSGAGQRRDPPRTGGDRGRARGRLRPAGGLGVGTAVRSPRRCWKPSGSPSSSESGLKGHLLPVVYLIEAAYLGGRLRARGVEHLHNHIGENSAAVAMMAAVDRRHPLQPDDPRPGEFDRPTELALDLKIRRASFVAAVTEFGRSQLYRWCRPRRLAEDPDRPLRRRADVPGREPDRSRSALDSSASVGSPSRRASSS